MVWRSALTGTFPRCGGRAVVKLWDVDGRKRRANLDHAVRQQRGV